VRGYAVNKADIDAFEQWLRAELAEMPGFERRSASVEVADEFRQACRDELEALGAVGGGVTFGYDLRSGQGPATALCPSFGVPGWTRGMAASDSSTSQDGRSLGWGEYHLEATDEQEPGYQVQWRFVRGDATVEVALFMPRP